MPKKIAVLMGSISDLDTIRPAISLLGELGIPYEAHVYSAHRTPAEAAIFSKQARANGFGVIIAAAGMAAHLAGAIAAQTTLPVIGLPVKGPHFDGLDALLSTVQMPQGIPVATVAVNGAYNAAMLAAQILAVEDAALAQKLAKLREQMANGVLAKDAQLQTLLNV
ncbi:MAG: 5-(carboxyamino)imidazole ribonucleotide mutase [Oscillospiraceae bacterium]|nr:5-(carboxyamino)imidazole ribonucleotide mutase [Oscillospiraceae bacterium]